MAVQLPGVVTQDNYTDAATLFPDKNTVQIQFVGQGNPYYVQFWKLNQSDKLSGPVLESLERLYPAAGGDSVTTNAAGVRFRSATPGQSATIYAIQNFKIDIISSAQAFAGSANPICGCEGGTVLEVTDGVTSVSPVTEIDFTSGATVTDAGGGVAQVSVLGGGSGLQFGGPDTPTYGPVNSGDYLDVETTGNNGSPPPSGYGYHVLDDTYGILIESDSGNGITIQSHSGSGKLLLAQASDLLAFFGGGGDIQQSSVGITTVAQLVTVLKNYGLLS